MGEVQLTFDLEGRNEAPPLKTKGGAPSCSNFLRTYESASVALWIAVLKEKAKWFGHSATVPVGSSNLRLLAIASVLLNGVTGEGGAPCSESGGRVTEILGRWSTARSGCATKSIPFLFDLFPLDTSNRTSATPIRASDFTSCISP
jgi:hypothetical protein